MKNILFALICFTVACTSIPETETQVETSPDKVQHEIDSLQVELKSLDVMIDKSRPNFGDDALSNSAKWDAPLTPAEVEFESHKAKKAKLEARLSELQDLEEATELE